VPFTGGIVAIPEPTIFEPLLLPDPASDPASELLEGVPPELLLPDPEPELPLLLADPEPELLPLLPEPDWPPDEPLLNEPLPEPLVEPFGVPLGPPVEPPLLPLPPLEVLPPAAFVFELVPLLLPGGWLFRELGVVREPEHSQAPPASAATSQGVHPILLMVTPSNQVRTVSAGLHYDVLGATPGQRVSFDRPTRRGSCIGYIKSTGSRASRSRALSRARRIASGRPDS
jgi:hypothetical protein